MDKKTTDLHGLPQKLIEHNIVEAETLLKAMEQAQKKRVSLVSHLVANKIANSLEIATVAANEFGVPLVDVTAIDPEIFPKGLVTEKLIRKHNALPIYHHGKRLYIAISDPTNLAALDEIKFQTGIGTEAVLAEEDKLVEVIESVLAAGANDSLGNLDDDALDDLDIAHESDDEENISQSEADDAPVVRFINKVLLDAINRGASDIHFEPYEKTYRVRFRQDGILQEIAFPPANLAPRLAARLKVMSRLNISERRVPQDGRFKMRISRNRSIDFRVSTCPTLFGEKVVMRILDPTSATLGIDALGYESFQKKYFLDAIAKPQGMVLVTGPTGSGKTVSLYTALNILNTAEVNISTAEDPVEINIAGINQVHVNPKAGLNFAAALKSFLRQDPDIVMVGEIRDLETAEIAVKAAQTGHLVLSTLHTNSAPETLTRMINMGVEPFNIATSVNLIIAQRLARRLCEQCKAIIKLPDETLKDLGFDEKEINELIIYQAKGCDKCSEGYKGRVGIYEVMPITEEIGRIIMQGGNSLDITDEARRNGVLNLRQAGLLKVKQGITSIEEINRITKE